MISRDKAKEMLVILEPETIIDDIYNSLQENHKTMNIGASDYSKKKIQPWDIIDEYELDFYEGNILKYLLRTKGSRKEDIEKIQHYVVKILADIKD